MLHSGPLSSPAVGYSSRAVRGALEAGVAGPLYFVPDPVFAAATGGRAVLRHLGLSGLIADFGQTAIKVIHGDARSLHPRDWQALPPADEVPPDQHGRQRLALRAFVASALRRQERPEAVVLGLPCDFPGGTPGACSYAGLEGDDDFVAEVLARAGLAGLPCVYLNDAVLAALSARELFRSELTGPTLVVTLGFGVGAALLEGGAGDGL
jgi:predicted NBD/HSP70 family sugar kinase